MNKISKKQKAYAEWIEETINNDFGQEIVNYDARTGGQAGKFIRENEKMALEIDKENRLQAELDNIHYGLNGL